MHREGASVLMTDVSSSALSAAHAKARSLSPSTTSSRLETLVVDVSSEASVAAAVDHVSAWGGVDVMFNNAGIMHPADGDAFECPDDVWERTMAVNVRGVWYGSKHAVRGFRAHGKTRGSVINTASMVALVGSATPQVAYTASKGAVLALTRELAIVHAREGGDAASSPFCCLTRRVEADEINLAVGRVPIQLVVSGSAQVSKPLSPPYLHVVLSLHLSSSYY